MKAPELIVYLIVAGLVATVLMLGVNAMAQDVTCSIGSYGKVIEQSKGRC